MNDIIIDCVFPLLCVNTSTSVFKKLCIVNKRFNQEFKDKVITATLDMWFRNSAEDYYWDNFETEVDDYSFEKNTFSFRLSRRNENYALHDVILIIENGIGLLTLDSGYVNNTDDDEIDSDDDDENSEFYDRIIRTFHNIQSLNNLLKIIHDITDSYY